MAWAKKLNKKGKVQLYEESAINFFRINLNVCSDSMQRR